jgi:hypothetical protein
MTPRDVGTSARKRALRDTRWPPKLAEHLATRNVLTGEPRSVLTPA